MRSHQEGVAGGSYCGIQYPKRRRVAGDGPLSLGGSQECPIFPTLTGGRVQRRGTFSQKGLKPLYRLTVLWGVGVNKTIQCVHLGKEYVRVSLGDPQ